MLGQVLRFGFVGALATLLHMMVGVTLIDIGLAALAANAIAFPIAFLVSFVGHYGFTFPDRAIPLAKSLRRFALIAIGGFATNELLLAVLVRTDIVPEDAGLVLSTGCAAAITFVVSRNWAFRSLPGSWNAAGRPLAEGHVEH